MLASTPLNYGKHSSSSSNQPGPRARGQVFRLFHLPRGTRGEYCAHLKTALIVVFLCGFALFSVHLKTELRDEPSPIAALKLNEPMPDFTVYDLAGKPVRFSELSPGKKVVAINFWATWCAPCRMEMPGFEKLFREKTRDGFTLLAINEDQKRPELDAYLKEKPVTFPVLIDREQKLAERFGINAFPTTILVGADGRVERVYEGVQPYLEYQIEDLLRHETKPKK